MSEFTAKDLENMTPEELSTQFERHNPLTATAFMIAEERQRRMRIDQHNLDMVLMTKQVKTMRFTAILGVIATLAGTILGVLLPYILPPRPPGSIPPIVQQENVASSVAGRRTETVLPTPTKEKDASVSTNSPPQK